MTYSDDELIEMVGSKKLLDNLNENMQTNKWTFLTSIRFWKLFLVGVNAGLIAYHVTHDIITSISSAIVAWLGGSVAVSTFDRTSDNNVAVAQINAGLPVESISTVNNSTTQTQTQTSTK